MVLEVKMPALSPTMEEGKIVSWNKKEGDKIDVGDVILEVETDKAIMEVEAQDKGTIGKLLYQLNDVVAVNKTIALLLEKGENADVLATYKVEESATASQETQKTEQEEKKSASIVEEKKQETEHNNIKSTYTIAPITNNKIFASPLAKNIAKQNNVNINSIPSGTGPNGRIIKADVDNFIKQNKNASFIGAVYGRNSVEYVDIEPTGMRGTIAKRLLESKQQIPHWYLKISADMTNFTNFRMEINKVAKIIDGKPEFKISANDIITMVIAKAIRKHPEINTIWLNGKIRKFNNIDISIACSVEGGILTPVVKNADQMGLLQLSSTIKEMVKKAREGSLSPSEYSGGAVSISNLGMYGVEEFTSIINPPQSCIIAVGCIQNKVVAGENGSIEARPYCNITFSADHRVIDGAVLAQFASDVKLFLEKPMMMLG